MWNVYHVEAYFEGAVKEICETLAGCEKGVRLGKAQGAARPAWFRIPLDVKAGETRAEGVSGLCRFKFISDRRGTRLAEEFHPEPKRVFYDFLMMIQDYRKSKGLSPLDLGFIHAFTEEGSPAVDERNYAAFSDGSMRQFQGLLEKKFGGTAMSALFGQTYITVFAENAKQTAMPPEYVPVCGKFLSDFERCYGFRRVLLLGVKADGKQRVYFAVKGKGLFYNTGDGSKEFLEEEAGRLSLSLTVIPGQAAREKGEAAPAGRQDYEYRAGRKGFRLYVNKKRTKMVIHPADKGPVNETTRSASKRPRDWIAEGATSGVRGGRLYRSLHAALEGEKALIESLFLNGNGQAVFK
jgi:hypothetical protein